MQYALLFYLDETKFSEPELESLAGEMRAVMNQAVAAGAMPAEGQNGRLASRQTATTQRVRDGKTVITDGPFAETKECLAGFWLVECADLDEALAWAERVPLARYGSVEVRPTRPCPP